MSTEFRTVETDELVGFRWGKGPRSFTGFEWGTTERVFQLSESKPDVVDESGRVYTWSEFGDEVTNLDTCTWTFGEFGGTFELGSGDLLDFYGTDGLE